MESSSNSNDIDIDTSMVNVNVNEEEEQQLLLVLPEDIVFQILLWLPVVSLVRFKSVCKSWCSLIQTSSFISQHKDKDTSHNNLLLLMVPSPLEVGGHNFIFKLLSSCGGGGDGGGNNNNNKFQTYENLVLPEYFKINKPIGLVICDGIICLHQSLGDDVSLWNPATKQFRILPRSQLPSLPPRNQHYMFIGFGFDVETNDYKVVRVRVAILPRRTLSSPHTLFMNGNFINQIEVYSLTNNSWKSLDFVLPINVLGLRLNMPLPYHNGGIYCWMGRDLVDEGNMPRILSFDFSKEIFGTISLPNDATFHQSRIFPQLAILREKLAAIRGDILSEIRALHYQIWVMNEFGVTESWTKLYTVGPFICSQPIGFPKNEDLFVLRKGKQICLCDPVTGQINNLPALDNGFNVQAAGYMESLLPV